MSPDSLVFHMKLLLCYKSEEGRMVAAGFEPQASGLGGARPTDLHQKSNYFPKLNKFYLIYFVSATLNLKVWKIRDKYQHFYEMDPSTENKVPKC